MVNKFKAEVKDIEQLTPDVRHFRLLVPKEFTFKPGQFIQVIVDKNTKRAYSIASAPNEHGYIELCVKKVKKGIGTNYLFSRQRGDTIDLMGPYGFLGEGDMKKDLVFISTGTGIAPFRSIIYNLLENKHKKKIILLTGFRYKRDRLYLNELKVLQEKYKNFKHFNIVSDPEDPNYKGEVGRVQLLMEKHIPKNFSGDYYICGIKGMVLDVEELLLSQGVDKKRIHMERFN